MNAAALTFRGLETVAAEDIKSLIGSKAEIAGPVLEFSSDDKGLAKLCYMGRPFISVMRLIAKADVDDDLEQSLAAIRDSIQQPEAKALIMRWLDKRTFKVACRRAGSQDYSSQDIAPKVGEMLLMMSGSKVQLEGPDIIVLVNIDDKNCHLGIDFAGFDLSRRDYKVFSHPESLNSSVAYGFVRLSGFKAKGVLADPFCGSGTIPIEAALYAKALSPHFFRKDRLAFHRFMKIDLSEFDPKAGDNEPKTQKGPAWSVYASDFLLRHVTSAKNNAKLAGVQKDIQLTKMDIEWLDTKLDKASVNLLVTHPPSVSRIHDEKQVAKLYAELVYQSDFVLKKGAKALVCTKDTAILKKALEDKKERFLVTGEIDVWQGRQKLTAVAFEKKS